MNPPLRWSNSDAQSKEPHQKFSLNSMNLEQLESILNSVAVHTSTCQPCVNGIDVPPGEAISLVGGKYSNGLASVLIMVVVSICLSQHHPKSLVLVEVSGGNAAWQLYGVKCV